MKRAEREAWAQRHREMERAAYLIWKQPWRLLRNRRLRRQIAELRAQPEPGSTTR